ncbi:MAG: sigma-70 family RNA polymerase sigma factor [Firmicutes bacterium]|nr:sigma-70 family RNA polymerase sigma factor [Bacillota bacterium]
MDDNKIIKLYWERNTSAINITERKYGGYCKSIAYNILKNNEDTEECVNDTYLKAWNSMPENWPHRLEVYLGTITRNLSFNKYRQKYSDKRGNGNLPLVLDELAECVSGNDSPEKSLEEKELILFINDFLASLPAKKRNLFVRRYWYADSISDIAKDYNMSAGSVTSNLKRIREKLKSYLLKRGIHI